MLKSIIGFIIGVIVGFLLFSSTPLGNRYYFLKGDNDLIENLYKVDTWTGKAWWCSYNSVAQVRGCIEFTDKELQPPF